MTSRTLGGIMPTSTSMRICRPATRPDSAEEDAADHRKSIDLFRPRDRDAEEIAADNVGEIDGDAHSSRWRRGVRVTARRARTHISTSRSFPAPCFRSCRLSRCRGAVDLRFALPPRPWSRKPCSAGFACVRSSPMLDSVFIIAVLGRRQLDQLATLLASRPRAAWQRTRSPRDRPARRPHRRPCR